MKIETTLPLGKLDPGLRAVAAPRDIRAVADDAHRAEALGYDGILTEETKDDPYIVMALAAQATRRVTLATAVAIAFPRSPTVTALSAWTLAQLSGCRFVLGLGSQVKGHIERRYGMRWSAPGPWLREYVQALRAIWDCWQNGTKLDFQGNHLYTWLVPKDLPDGYLEVHTFSVDSNGNLYGGDNQYGRTQKFVPKPGADPKLLVRPPWVAR